MDRATPAARPRPAKRGRIAPIHGGAGRPVRAGIEGIGGEGTVGRAGVGCTEPVVAEHGDAGLRDERGGEKNKAGGQRKP